MPFDTDAEAQIRRIDANLHGCAQTPPDEQSELKLTINSIIAGRSYAAIGVSDVKEVQTTVRETVERKSWYLRGKDRPELSAKVLYSTQTEVRLEKNCMKALIAEDTNLTESESLRIARQLIADLQSNPTFAAAKLDSGSIALHDHGTPMWLSDPNSATPPADSAIDLLPARLGIAPNAARYLLLKLIPGTCRDPRFSDSGAYPYWRPGGRTLPIEQCPADHATGFHEVLTDGVTLFDLKAPLISYQRAI